MTDDEKTGPITIGEFADHCMSMFEGLYQMLETFDDDTDPVGIADAIVARCIEHYIGPPKKML